MIFASSACSACREGPPLGGQATSFFLADGGAKPCGREICCGRADGGACLGFALVCRHRGGEQLA
jgi:hypothetical protein